MLAYPRMNRVHVAIDLRILDRAGMERSGIGRHALESARALRRVRPDWQLTLVTNRSDLFEATPATTLGRTRWPTGSSLGRVSWLEAAPLGRVASAADILLAPSFFLHRAWSGPSIVMIHDLVFAEKPALYRGRANSLYATRATEQAARRANLVLCATSSLRARIVDELGVPVENVRVIPWGGVVDVFRRGRGRPAERNDEPFWLFAGRWETRKGLDVLAAARAEVARRGGPDRLVLVGEPGRGVEGTLAKLRADPAVTIESGASDARLAELYREALALLYPSRIEGFGLPVAEAMAAGCPVIASELPELREWAADVPQYVPAGDAHRLAEAMLALAADPDRRGAMAEQGVAAAAGLDWDRVGEGVAQAVEAVLDAPASSA